MAVQTVTLNGFVYSDGDDDGGSGQKFLGNDGHRTNFVPMFGDMIVENSNTVTSSSLSETNAAASAATALAAPGTNATSTTSDTVTIGATTITVQTGKDFVVGMSVKIASTASPTNWMHGDITNYTTGTGSLTVQVTSISGSGTLSAWTVSISGPNDLTDHTSLQVSTNLYLYSNYGGI